ncbi:SURF1 family protein [Sphingomonas sp. GCM10030256]|uniref:SURF1 family protein n=1 Tax=Sphingomonas sp. GCM10030256 TaxID=3273427 RepID=UPI0036089C2B
MTRRIPLLPTLVVAAAVLVMVGLGIWQLQRAAEKEASLARYNQAEHLPAVAWPTVPVSDTDLPLFRQASGLCLRPVFSKAVAGRNRRGESGYSHLVDCDTGAEGPGMRIDIGWSRDPLAGAAWRGGPVAGVIGPDSQVRMRLISASGQAGLEASAPPSPADIPNNHRSYAVQWFLFALSALIIYGLALRGRRAKTTS